MTASSVTPMRLRRWEPPKIGAMYRRKDDGTIWYVRGVYRQDQQVRLERRERDQRPIWLFANMLNADWEKLS